MNDNEWRLLARYLSGECSQEEAVEVEARMEADGEYRNTVQFFKAAWDTPEVEPQTSDVNKLWSEVAQKAGITAAETTENVKEDVQGNLIRFPLVYKRIMKIAAAILVVVSLFLFWPQGTKLEEIRVAGGQTRTLTLSDGTTVTCDAGTLFKFPVQFDGSKREVYLNGEAYFEVAHRENMPFIVHANHAMVTVLGTKFNVRAWQDSRKVKVAVAEGKVSLRGEKAAAKTGVLIKKGHLSVLPEKGRPTVPEQVDVAKYLGWLKREIVFEDTPFLEILKQVERWHNVHFVVDPRIALTDRLNVHIRDKSLEEVLDLLAVLVELKYKREDGIVHLEPAK